MGSNVPVVAGDFSEDLPEESFRYTAKLLVREPGLEDVTVILNRPLVVLGRDPDCDARLHTPYVSRRHARIEMEGDLHYVCDEGSTNGTLVNGHRIEGRTELVHGDEINLSNVRLWYLIDIPRDQKTPTLQLSARRRSTLDGLLLSVDEGTHSVWVEETKSDIPLSALEFKLVHYLFSLKGQVATREEIGVAVWGEGAFENETLYRLVDRVKTKIEPDPGKPRFLISHRGVGYSLKTERA